MVKTNSLKAWILASRPKTLTAAAVPVMVGVAFAYYRTIMFRDVTIEMVPDDTYYTGMENEPFFLNGVFHWTPAILCLLFAWVMQIASNFVNDYYDYKKGLDDSATRLGPKRACAEGWVTTHAMKWAIRGILLLGCLVGFPLVFYGGREMLHVGLVCVIFCVLYTTTLSHIGLGDALVLVFFGIIPVTTTYYVCMPVPIQLPTFEVFLASVACGLVTDTLLVVNNFRDRDNDKASHKITLVVKLGPGKSKLLYQWLGYVGVVLMSISSYNILDEQDCHYPLFLIFIPYLLLHVATYREMARINEGKELNKTLGKTARNIFVFGLTSTLLILSTLLFLQV